jgi:hypothetical protein
MAEETSEKTQDGKGNIWKISTIILGVLFLIAVVIAFKGGITGNVISEDKIGQYALEFSQSKLGVPSETTLSSVSLVGGVYEIKLNYEGEEVPLYFTKDGKWIQQGTGLISIIPESNSITGNVVNTPTETILECSQNYGITEDTIIFLYSDSCGWCARMKPGVDSLEQRGYKIYRAEASKSEPLITNCVSPYMTSEGVPQFVCVKTGEIKVGAFADSEGNLNQQAMDSWVNSCLAD